MKHRLLMHALFVASLALSATANATLYDPNFTTIKIEATVGTGDFAGTVGTGVITYNQDLLDIDSYLYPDFSTDWGLDPVTFILDMEFSVFDQTYTTVNDADFPYFPEVEFAFNPGDPAAGDPVHLIFGVFDTGIAGINSFEIFDFLTFAGTDMGYDVYTTSLTVDGVLISPVPVPAAAWLFGTGLLGLAGFGRRKKKTA